MRITVPLENVTDLGLPYVPALRQRVGHDLIAVPGARAVIPRPDGDEILLHRRVDFDLWGLPAGSPEIGEPILDCLRREVFEEIDLEVAAQQCFGYSSNPREEVVKFPNGDLLHCYSLLFEVQLAHYDLERIDRAKVAPETKAIAWHRLDSLPPMISNHRRSLHLYREFRRTGQFQLD